MADAWFRRGKITAAQFEAAIAILEVFGKVEAGGAQAVDYGAVRVDDCSTSPDAKMVNKLHAVQRLADIEGMVSREALKRVKWVLFHGLELKTIARHEAAGQRTERQVKSDATRIGKQVVATLDHLAVILG